MVYQDNCWRVALKIRPIYRNFWHSALFLAQPVGKPYPLWHTFGVQNPTLSGTLLENPTLCGTDIGQNGTLAVLEYAHCRQWECPPGGLCRMLVVVNHCPYSCDVVLHLIKVRKVWMLFQRGGRFDLQCREILLRCSTCCCRLNLLC